MGSFAGYVANRAAVKMLFWPHKNIMIAGRKLPVPVGVIVKKRSEMVSSIASKIIESRLVEQAVRHAFRSYLKTINNREPEASPVPFTTRWMIERHVKGMSRNDYIDMYDKIGSHLTESDCIRKALAEKVESIPPDELEKSMRLFFRREFATMSMADSLIGGIIGLMHGVMSILIG